ncbi:MAG TPA: AAA family ATPase, partial [Jatrophihabitans sp.]|nr:AAA family ATPase [Jatrophihabitans sp.]
VALARYLDRPATPVLAAELERVLAGDLYEREVFFVRPIGFLVATDVRRISYAESLRFETVHEQVYREYGFEIVDVPANLTAEERAALVERHLAED